jgi:GGDEF domain-containing protein
LKAIADVALETLRRSDTVGRIGGDEFAVIFPETGRTEALFAVDKLQHKLRAVTRLRQWRGLPSTLALRFYRLPALRLLPWNSPIA